jgi:succinyl-diaminopimelate desuccinylase
MKGQAPAYSVSPALSDRLRWRIEGLRNAMVGLMADITALSAVGPDNGGGGEWERSRYLTEFIESLRLGPVAHFDSPDTRAFPGMRPNLALRIEGYEPSPTVWVMAHLDTVPPGEESLWSTPPFQAVVEDGRIYGRGTEDNQQAIVSMLCAVRALADEQLRPTTDVGLLFVADEETGNTHGIEHVLTVEPDLVRPEDLVVVPDFGSPDGAFIEVAEKSILHCRVTVRGRQAHAAMPHAGTNAHRAAAHLTVRLDERLHERFPCEDPLFFPPASTFEPTKREATVPNVNTIPGVDMFYFDCRILPSLDVEDVKAVIGDEAGVVADEFQVDIDISYPTAEVAAPPTPVDAPITMILAEAVRQVRGVEPKAGGIGGGTVAALFRRRGIPAVAWSTMDDVAHQPNEYCIIDNMLHDALVFAHLFVRGQ